MDSEQREVLRTRIREALETVRRDVVRLEEASKPVPPDKALGRITRMESLADRGMSQAALGTAQERLHHLDQALEKIDRPGFGDCVVCRRPIPFERLLALPESTRCVNCSR